MFPSPAKGKRNRKRRKKTKSINAYIIAAVAAIIALICLLIILISGGEKVLKAVPQLVADGDTKATTQNDIYFERDGVLYCTDYSGNQKWHVELQSADMKLFASEDSVIAYNAVLVQVFNRSGENTSNTQFHGTVKRVCGSDKYTAALVEDASGTSRIVLLDKQGKEIRSESFEKQFILDFGFFAQGSFFVHTLATDSLVPISRIITYNSDLNSTGNIRIDSQLVQHIEFKESEIIAVCTNHIIVMDYLGNKKSEKLIYGWKYKDSFISSNKSIFLFVQGGETASQDFIHTARICELGNKDVYLQLPAKTIEVSLGREKIYAFTENLVRVYNLSGGIISEHMFSQEVDKITLVNNKQIILTTVGMETEAVKLP